MSMSKISSFIDSVTYTAPSNIALIKYWGKKPVQLPCNASLSFTLNNCHTKTRVSYKKKETINDEFNFQFFFEGAPKPSFEPKLQSFFERIEAYCPFLKEYEFLIESENSFPHSSGIASSASAMAALASCLVAIESKIEGTDFTTAEKNQKASRLARLGSGSAARSIEGPIMVWGKHDLVTGSNDDYAVVFDKPIAPIFQNFQDTILLIDKGEKQVSSTVGHGLMKNHPFAKQRFLEANKNLSVLSKCLVDGDMETFIKIVEHEALSLHAMMLTSDPYFILLKPNTLKAIEEIRAFRKKTGINICFTLDAGANLHVLYPNSHKKEVLHFIDNVLYLITKGQGYICDYIGNGVENI